MGRFGVGAVSPLWNAGYVCNPFRALSNDEWQEIALLPATVRALLVGDIAPHLQIVGDAGRGKSSLLRAIVREAATRQIPCIYEYIPNNADTFVSNLSANGWFCLDEAQRLIPDERTRLLQMAKGKQIRLIVGTHDDLTPLFAQAGLPLETVRVAEFGEAHFAAVLQNRLTYFARPGVESATLAPDALIYLRERFDSDLRGAERFLYEFFQLMVVSPTAVTKTKLQKMFCRGDTVLYSCLP